MGFTKVLSIHVETKEFVSSISCDKCGKEAVLTGPQSSNKIGSAPAGFHWIKLSGGYASDFPEDGDILDILTCDACLKEWVDSFKTAPHNSSFIFQNPVMVSFGRDTLWLNHNVLETNKFQTAEDLDKTRDETPDDRVADCYSDRIAESKTDESLVQIYQTAIVRATGRHAVIYRLMHRDASQFYALDIDDWSAQYKFLDPELT